MEGCTPYVVVVAFRVLMLPWVAPVAVCVAVVLVGVLLPCCCPSVGLSSFLFRIGAGVRLDSVRNRVPRAALVA